MADSGGGSRDKALRRAFKLLDYRPRSEAELRSRLSRSGFSPECTEPVLEKLRSLNLLNDGTFAREWARGKAERGYGPLRVEQELRQKGIAPSLIGDVLRETFDEDRGRTRAKALLERKFRGMDLADRRILRRAAGFLERRGYRDGDITEILKEAAAG
jgi:regulatory protein